MRFSFRWMAGAGVACTLVALVAGSGRIAFAQHGGFARAGFGGPPMMGEGPMMGDGSMILLPLLFKSADLTADQQPKVQQILAAHRDTFRSLFSKLHAANNDLAAKLVAPGQLDANDVAPLVSSIAQLRQQMMQEGVNVALEVRAMLTNDQLTKLSSVRQQLESLHAQMRALLGGKDQGF